MRLFHPAPDLRALSHDGDTVALRDHRGHYLLLYFFPKANTSGCTKEAKDFTARSKAFARLDATILGASPDSPEALAKFSDSKQLRITLLSDPHRALAKAFHAHRPTGGILRSTFLFDRAGYLRWRWLGVKVHGHVDEVLSVLKDLHRADQHINPTIDLRRSRRAIAPTPIPDAHLWRLIEAAALAPSCFNNQPWRLVVAQGQQLDDLKKAIPKGNYWAQDAPVILAITSHPDLDCRLSDSRDYFLFDSGLAVQNLLLQATQMGLVAHPIAGFSPKKAKKALSIPTRYTVIALIVVARPGPPDRLNEDHQKAETVPRNRLPLDQIASWQRFTFNTD